MSPVITDYTGSVLGVDLGDRRSLACGYRAGEVVGWFGFAMTHEGAHEASAADGYAKVAMQAGAQSSRVPHRLQRLEYAPVVASSRSW